MRVQNWLYRNTLVAEQPLDGFLHRYAPALLLAEKLRHLLTAPSCWMPAAPGECNQNQTLLSNGSCVCLPGYYGTTCQFGYCDSNPCGQGKCVGDYISKFVCQCPDNYCQNNGTCAWGGGANYGCTCRPGFSGGTCRQTQCSDQPCGGNGAVCTPTGNTYTCSCGRTRQCFNGGSCSWLPPSTTSDYSAQYTCNCPSGTQGTLCEIQACNLANGQQCLNGGTCAGRTCACPTGWTGYFCELPLPQGFLYGQNGSVADPSGTAVMLTAATRDTMILECAQICQNAPMYCQSFDIFAQNRMFDQPAT